MSKPTEIQRNQDTMMPSQHNVTLLAEQLAQASPRRIIESAANILPGRLAVVSSFGTESAVLLKFVAEVDRSLPILFLDTLWLFKENLSLPRPARCLSWPDRRSHHQTFGERLSINRSQARFMFHRP